MTDYKKYKINNFENNKKKEYIMGLADLPIEKIDSQLLFEIAKNVAIKNNIKFNKSFIAFNNLSKIEGCYFYKFDLIRDAETGISFLFLIGKEKTILNKIKSIFKRK